MTNNYGIPALLEARIRAKYKFCVYCGLEMKVHSHAIGCPCDKATIEHLNEDSVLQPTENNIVMCCQSCNASRGPKKLLDWFESEYCKKKNINSETVADVVKKYIKSREMN